MQTPVILTVSQLNTYAKSVIEQDNNLNNVFLFTNVINWIDRCVLLNLCFF